MKINILISKNSWANSYKIEIKKKLKKFSKNISFNHDHKKIKKGTDINIIFSYFKKIQLKYLNYSKYNLIPHESKLPKGKGMSPLSWQLLENKGAIFFSLIEAENSLDSGRIYLQKKISIPKNIVFREIKELQLSVNLKLITMFLTKLKKNRNIIGIKQKGRSTFYPKRSSKHSIININKSIKSQFNLLRICDPENYPAYFKYKNRTYLIKIFPK